MTHGMTGRRGASPVPGGQPEGEPAVDTAQPGTSPLSDVHMDWEALRGSTTPTLPLADQQAAASRKSGDDAAAAASRRPLSGAPKRSISSAASAKDKSSDKPDKAVGAGSDDCTAYFQPTPLLHMNSERSESVVLSDFCCHGENMLLLVETTAPPAGRRLRKRRSLQAVVAKGAGNMLNGASSSTTSQDTAQHETSSGASEMDTVGMAASWIRRELSDNEVVRPRGFKGARAGHRSDGGGGSGIPPPAASSLQSLSDGDLESIEGDDDDSDNDDDATDDEEVGDENSKTDGRWAMTAHEQLPAGGINGLVRDSALPQPAGARSEPDHYQVDRRKGGPLSPPAVQQLAGPQFAASSTAEAKRGSSSGESGIRTIDDLASTYSGSPEHLVATAASKDAAATAKPEGHAGASVGKPQRDGGHNNGSSHNGGSVGGLPSAASKLVVVPRVAPRSPKHRKRPTTAALSSARGHELDGDRRSAGSGSGSSAEAAHRLGSAVAAAMAASPDDRIRVLVDQLMEEKRHQEQRMKDMEDRHREREQHIRMEAQRSVAERELLMQEEIRKLREELTLQHQQMQENMKMLFLLQQQLMRASGSQAQVLVTSEQLQQQKQVHPEARSKVCSIQ